MLNKTPLVRWERHFAFTRGSAIEIWPPHLVDPAYARRRGMAGALLHFKFLAEFIAKVDEEQSRQQHTDEYNKYRVGLEDDHRKSFMYEGTMRYESWRSLQDCGLIS